VPVIKQKFGKKLFFKNIFHFYQPAGGLGAGGKAFPHLIVLVTFY
jgi:hypothetical protein